jgi:hypothetical protein
MLGRRTIRREEPPRRDGWVVPKDRPLGRYPSLRRGLTRERLAPSSAVGEGKHRQTARNESGALASFLRT